MKKRIIGLLLLLTIVVIAIPAWAEAYPVTENVPYSWDVLKTIAGATAATLLVVQYLKDLLDRWTYIPTRLVVLTVATLINVGAQAFTTGIAAADIPLLILNSFVVSFAAMGAYDTAIQGRMLKGEAIMYADEITDEEEPPDGPGNPA